MDLDHRLRALSERQHGVVARSQARDLGATRHHLRRRTGPARRVDFLDRDHRLVIEVDSDLHHRSLLDEAADAARDAALAGAGYTVVRISEHDLWHRADEIVRRLLAS